MVARSYTSSQTYDYGFNGKMKDDEIVGGDYDYGFRIYDARLARFLSVDPLTKGYPWYTPYQFAGNNPIKFIDIDGLEQGTFEINDQDAHLATLSLEKTYYVVTAGANAVHSKFIPDMKTEEYRAAIQYAYEKAPAEEMFVYLKNVTFDEKGDMHYEISDKKAYDKKGQTSVWKVKVQYNIKVEVKDNFTEADGEALVKTNPNLNGYIVGYDGPENEPGKTAYGSNKLRINNNRQNWTAKILGQVTSHEASHGMGMMDEHYYVEYNTITNAGCVVDANGKAIPMDNVQLIHEDIEEMLKYGNGQTPNQKIDRSIKQKVNPATKPKE